MKIKKIVIFVIISFVMIVSVFASEISFSFDIGPSSGIPFYGDDNVKEISASLYDDGHRIVVGATIDMNLNVAKYLTCFVGSDLLCDINWNDDLYFNHFDLAIFPGVKIYPNLGGLNVSFAYVFGTRFDFDSISDEELSYDEAAWGNGIRLGLEYNFYYTSKTMFMPSIGVYWRWIPRGSYHNDNVIGVYALINL